jgi:hypothetical protein
MQLFRGLDNRKLRKSGWALAVEKVSSKMQKPKVVGSVHKDGDSQKPPKRPGEGLVSFGHHHFCKLQARREQRDEPRREVRFHRDGEGQCQESSKQSEARKEKNSQPSEVGHRR